MEDGDDRSESAQVVDETMQAPHASEERATKVKAAKTVSFSDPPGEEIEVEMPGDEPSSSIQDEDSPHSETATKRPHDGSDRPDDEGIASSGEESDDDHVGPMKKSKRSEDDDMTDQAFEDATMELQVKATGAATAMETQREEKKTDVESPTQLSVESVPPGQKARRDSPAACPPASPPAAEARSKGMFSPSPMTSSSSSSTGNDENGGGNPDEDVQSHKEAEQGIQPNKRFRPTPPGKPSAIMTVNSL